MADRVRPRDSPNRNQASRECSRGATEGLQAGWIFASVFTIKRTNDVTPSVGAWALLFAVGGSSPLYYYAGLAALVGAGVWAGILAYSSWREAHEELDPATPAELLDAFERARAQGDLSAEELARLRDRINRGD